MTRRARQGQAEWRARPGSYPAEVSEQIKADAGGRMERWAARGRVPILIRLFARLRGQRIELPDPQPR
jgi:hypothetical protein